MIIERAKLQEALKIVEPGLAEKEIPYLEQAKSFAFRDGRIITYNDEISVSHPVEGWKDINGVIQAKMLYDFLGKLKTKELDIFLNKKSELVIKSDKAKAGLTMQTEFKLPVGNEVRNWKPLPENFLDAVKFAAGCASTDSTDPILICIHVNESGYVEASDSYRIVRYELSGELGVKTFLLPAKSAMDMLKIKPVEIAEGEGWVHFQTEEGTLFSCRIIDEKFPNTTPHLDVKGNKVVFPAELKEMVVRAMTFAERKNRLDEIVKVTMKDGLLKVRSEAEIAGWFEEDIPVEYKDEPIIFTATPYLLKDILEQTLSCVINKERNKLKFEGENWQYMAALRYEG